MRGPAGTTPGPWIAVPSGNIIVIASKAGHGTIVAEVHGMTGVECDDATRANARLIAAAPYLYEAVAQYAEDPCACQDPRPGGPSCSACYSRAALREVTP